MKLLYAGLAILAAGAIFFAGWWCGSFTAVEQTPPEPAIAQPSAVAEQLRAEIKEKDEALAAVNKQLLAVKRDVETQRAMLREHNLTQTARSIDELLALFPAPFPAGDWRPAETVFEDCWFETIDGMRLHGWYLPHESPEAVILYAHGNAGNVSGRGRVAYRLNQQFGASVLVFDYRGYGRSEGTPTIEGLLHDTRAARDFLARREEIDPAEVVLLGRSLGTSMATQIAAEDGARALILQSPFASLKQAAAGHYPGWLVNVLVADRLNSRENIKRYQGPLLISHGTADRTIAFQQGVELYEAANEPKAFFRITGGAHNTPLPDAYYDRLGAFLKDIND